MNHILADRYDTDRNTFPPQIKLDILRLVWAQGQQQHIALMLFSTGFIEKYNLCAFICKFSVPNPRDFTPELTRDWTRRSVCH